MMSSKDFLKSVEGKLSNNKRKAEPDMRMSVLLGCTSKRIRREIKCEIVRENKKEQVKIESFVDNKWGAGLKEVTNRDNNASSLLMDTSSNGDALSSALVDDPTQVELFLRQVESQTQPQLNNNKDVAPTNTLSGPYSFIEKSVCLSEPILPGNPDIDVNVGILCANFESLYEDLLDSLISVERWMDMASNQSTDTVDRDHGALSQDQQEIMMDLSKVLGI